MRIFTILLFCFCGFNVLAESCKYPNEGTAYQIANTEQIHLNKVELYNNVYADPIEIEFWVEECITDNRIKFSLFATITPTIPGKSKGVGVYDIAVIQNNQQYNGVLSFSDNLYVPSHIWAGLLTNYDPDDGTYSSIFSDGLNISEPFTLIFSCNNSSSSLYEACSAVNSDHFLK